MLIFQTLRFSVAEKGNVLFEFSLDRENRVIYACCLSKISYKLLLAVKLLLYAKVPNDLNLKIRKAKIDKSNRLVLKT